MSKFILVPHAIAEKCSLWEALHWVVFNHYPMAQFTDDNIDRREHIEYNDTVEFDVPEELNEFFTEAVCKKYNLPRNAFADYFDQYHEYPFFSAFSGEQIASFINSGNFKEEDIERIVADRKKQDEFDKAQLLFDDAIDNVFEEYKAELFAALRKGRVQALGRNLLKDVSDPDSDLHEIWASGVEPEFEKIPAQEWYFSCVNWEDSTLLKSKKTAYCHILISFESLLSVFPEPEPEIKQVMMVNGVLLDMDSTTGVIVPKSKNVGRPAYDWPSFQTEMSARLLRGKLPALQKSCVIEMSEWCIKQWGESPSETNLKNNISPFYKALKSFSS